jgi:hypothetical protein
MDIIDHSTAFASVTKIDAGGLSRIPATRFGLGAPGRWRQKGSGLGITLVLALVIVVSGRRSHPRLRPGPGLLNLGADNVLLQEACQDAEAEVVTTADKNLILAAEGNDEESIRAFVTTLGFEEVEFSGRSGVSPGRSRGSLARSTVETIYREVLLEDRVLSVE